MCCAVYPIHLFKTGNELSEVVSNVDVFLKNIEVAVACNTIRSSGQKVHDEKY